MNAAPFQAGASLHAFFSPQVVAVIGASATPGKLGHSVVRNLLRGGFAGRICPINPGANPVEGLPAFTSIAAIDAVVDSAFLAIPAAGVLAAVRECAEAGVRSVVIGASGFAEVGTAQGRALQDEISRVAAAAGMRVIGPNTNGLLDTYQRFSFGYNASHGEAFRQAPISILSHSGALFDGIAKRLQGYGAGLSKFVAVGNELDVSMLELLEHLVDDPHTQVVGLVIEGLSDGARLRRVALRLAQAGKQVVALKIGRSAEGAGAALAHSSRMAGNSRAWDAMLTACGFASVRSVEALAGACAVLAGRRDARADRRLVCVTTSGAGGAILADFAAERDLPIAPQWSGETERVVRALPTPAPIRNPIDMGSLGDWSLLAPSFEAIEAGGYLGPTVVYAHVAPGPGMAQHLMDALLARQQRVGQPMVILSPGGLGQAVEDRYNEAGIPVFHDTVTCFESLAVHHGALTPWPLPALAPAADPAIASTLRRAVPGQALSELDSAAILRAAGVPMVHSEVARSADECLDKAASIGYPLVLKGMVPGVAHKHAAGLVGVGIDSPQALRAEFERQHARVQTLEADSKAFWLLQPMVRGRLELIAGVTHDPGLGHFLVWGLGGVHTEILGQIDLAPIPAAPADLQAQVRASRTGQLLHSMQADGRAQQALVDVLMNLQQLIAAQAQAIASIDVNPLLLVGDRLVAVDALVVPHNNHP